MIRNDGNTNVCNEFKRDALAEPARQLTLVGYCGLSIQTIYEYEYRRNAIVKQAFCAISWRALMDHCAIHTGIS
jgi:hypothetical protein